MPLAIPARDGRGLCEEERAAPEGTWGDGQPVERSKGHAGRGGVAVW